MPNSFFGSSILHSSKRYIKREKINETFEFEEIRTWNRFSNVELGLIVSLFHATVFHRTFI